MLLLELSITFYLSIQAGDLLLHFCNLLAFLLQLCHGCVVLLLSAQIFILDVGYYLVVFLSLPLEFLVNLFLLLDFVSKCFDCLLALK